MAISLSHLRQNIFQIFDEIISTGKPVEINRHGNIVLIFPPQKSQNKQNAKQDKLASLTKHRNVINGDPDDFVQINWESEWHNSICPSI